MKLFGNVNLDFEILTYNNFNIYTGINNQGKYNPFLPEGKWTNTTLSIIKAEVNTHKSGLSTQLVVVQYCPISTITINPIETTKSDWDRLMLFYKEVLTDKVSDLVYAHLFNTLSQSDTYKDLGYIRETPFSIKKDIVKVILSRELKYYSTSLINLIESELQKNNYRGINSVQVDNVVIFKYFYSRDEKQSPIDIRGVLSNSTIPVMVIEK